MKAGQHLTPTTLGEPPSPVAPRRHPATGSLALSVAALTFVATGCSSGGAAFDSIRGGNENADRVRSYDSWGELVALAREGSPGADAADAAVVGDVVDVVEGRSFVWTTDVDGSERRREVGFGSEDAMTSTYHLTVDVTGVVGSADDSIEVGEDLTIGLSVDSDVSLDDVATDFGDLEDAVFFLQRSPVFDYDADLFAIVEDGALVALSEGDTMSFPLLAETDPVQPPRGVTAESLVKK